MCKKVNRNATKTIRKGDIFMENKKNEFLNWINTHKKQLLVAGVSVVIIVSVISCINDKENLIELWTKLRKFVPNTVTQPNECISSIPSSLTVSESVSIPCKYTTPKKSFEVSRHIRTLPGGRHHSSKKAAEAASLGIVLQPNQTLVDGYQKYNVA